LWHVYHESVHGSPGTILLEGCPATLIWCVIRVFSCERARENTIDDLAIETSTI